MSERARFRVRDDSPNLDGRFEDYVRSDSYRAVMRDQHADLIQVPVGTCVLFAGSSAPENWLKCDGAVYPIAKYSKLYAVVKNTYGGSAGASTFAVPNLAAVSGIYYYVRY